ncbi:hypothetical protein BGX33_004379 [Mortierella sp. NVP41]|nr:hypothetical protein BGX33_004379 [Mortierella sp. NVP41]
MTPPSDNYDTSTTIPTRRNRGSNRANPYRAPKPTSDNYDAMPIWIVNKDDVYGYCKDLRRSFENLELQRSGLVRDLALAMDLALALVLVLALALLLALALPLAMDLVLVMDLTLAMAPASVLVMRNFKRCVESLS